MGGAFDSLGKVGGAIKQSATPTLDAQGRRQPSALQQGVGSGIQQGFQNYQSQQDAMRRNGGGMPMQAQPQPSLADFYQTPQAPPAQWPGLQPTGNSFYGR